MITILQYLCFEIVLSLSVKNIQQRPQATSEEPLPTRTVALLLKYSAETYMNTHTHAMASNKRFKSIEKCFVYVNVYALDFDVLQMNHKRGCHIIGIGEQIQPIQSQNCPKPSYGSLTNKLIQLLVFTQLAYRKMITYFI